MKEAIELIRMEALRLRRHSVSCWVVGGLLALLVASAAWSGWQAGKWRSESAQRESARAKAIDDAFASANDAPSLSVKDSVNRAAAAHRLGKSDAGVIGLPATGGLVLGVDRYRALPTSLRATVDSRYADNRAVGKLGNPLLAETGMPSFTAVIVLLLPLAAIALTAGSVQEDREAGVWRLVIAQGGRRALDAFVVAAFLRWAVLFMVAASASVLAFTLDLQALHETSRLLARPVHASHTVQALCSWLIALAWFCAFWVLLGSLLSTLTISSGAAMTCALGLWLALTFGVPAVLLEHAKVHLPAPSRLEAVLELRAAQQDAEQSADELLRRWYEANPSDRPSVKVAPAEHGWPVTFMARYWEQERRLRSIMRELEGARHARAVWIERFAWLSPPLALTLEAERIAGIDAARYRKYGDAVERFDEAWRSFFVPRIVSYRGLSSADAERMPRLSPDEKSALHAVSPHSWALIYLAASCIALLVVVAARRRRIERP